MKVLKILVLFLFFFSCNSPRAVYDYDTTVEFDQFETYNFYPDFITGLDPLDEKRLLSSLKEELRDVGFSFSPRPDLYVNVYAEKYQENNRNTVGVGIGGGGGNLGVGVSGRFPLGGPDTILRLTIDFIDAENDELVWQAVIEGKIERNASPELRQAQLNRLVEKALKAYPPEK